MFRLCAFYSFLRRQAGAVRTKDILCVAATTGIREALVGRCPTSSLVSSGAARPRLRRFDRGAYFGKANIDAPPKRLVDREHALPRSALKLMVLQIEALCRLLKAQEFFDVRHVSERPIRRC